MDDCIFCKIVKGELPSYTVYEDDIIKAFLDITPANEGHTLIIPKEHRKDLFDISDFELSRISSVAKKLALKYKEEIGMDFCNLIQSTGAPAGQEVFHFHMHLVPRKENDGLNIWRGKQTKKPDFEELLKKLKMQ